MTRMAGRARRLIVAIGVVILTMSAGNAAGGTGFLSLSADGTVEMHLILEHRICFVCGGDTRTLLGTYFTAVMDQGCYFQMELSTPPSNATTDTIVGMVAFEGRQLVFAASTSPDFASGLALRYDALTGR
jgi:hypothetical protein